MLVEGALASGRAQPGEDKCGNTTVGGTEEEYQTIGYPNEAESPAYHLCIPSTMEQVGASKFLFNGTLRKGQWQSLGGSRGPGKGKGWRLQLSGTEQCWKQSINRPQDLGSG